MTSQPDPYRTLGVAPGASVNEIRSAYRRLAKQYHPDAAGDRTLPRFLAIQAAYERLVDGEGLLRTRESPPAAEPWRADPARARASRDAWRARRSSPPGGAGPAAAGPSSREGEATGAAEGSRPGGGAAGASQPGAETSGRRAGGAGSASRGRGGAVPRGVRKARPGSTTYDDAAAAPLDPDWDGGAWYGPSSGTFWTLNPREYADPRKHGPEYQARARRAAGERGRAAPRTGPQTAARAPDEDEQRAPVSEAPAAAGPATEESTSAPEAAALPDLEVFARRFAPAALLAVAHRPDRRWRILLAVAGWPPIGLALATLLMDASGCSRFAATCPAAVPVVAWLIQPAVIAVLALGPVLAATAAFASVAALVVVVPVAAVLAVGTVPESRAGAPALAVAVALAWFAGIVGATRSLLRPEIAPRGT